MAGQRSPAPLAIEGESAAIASGDDAEILRDYDDPPPGDDIGDYPRGIQRQRESAEIVDAAIVDAGQTDAGARPTDD